MVAQKQSDLYQRALKLSQRADAVELVRALQFALVGGFAGAAIGFALKVLLPAVIIGVVVGGIIGWKDAGVRAYLLRMEASKLLDQCAVANRDIPHVSSKIRYLNFFARRRHNS